MSKCSSVQASLVNREAPGFLETDPRMGCRTGLGPDPELSILNVLNQLALS